jgi:single-stranded DNA-binding protein
MRKANTVASRNRISSWQEIGWKRKPATILTIVTALLMVVFVPALRAQIATADIVGTVTDTSGGVVPAARVTATSIGTGIVYPGQTASDGNFLLTQLPVGHYRVTITKNGFKTYDVPDIGLTIGERVRQDARLEVGAATQTIEVQAEGVQLQTDSATVQSTIEEHQVQDLPLEGRNFAQLVQLVPGATDYVGGTFSNGNALDDRRRGSAVSVNGFLGTENNFMIDGMDNNERFIGTTVVKPSIEAIGEVKVITNTFSAEMSRANGAGVSFITKGGSNQIHGSAFEFFRNQSLDARLPMLAYTAPKQATRQNNFGGSVGGPIKKNKTFYFGDFESYLLYSGALATSTVPLQDEKGGNFTGIAASGSIAQVVIYDPASTTPCATCSSGFTRTPFPNFTIPQSRIDPIAAKILTTFYPLPNQLGVAGGAGAAVGPGNYLLANNYIFDPARNQHDNTMDERIDHRFSDKDSFYARYSFNHTTTISPPSLPIVTPGFDPGSSNYTVQSNDNAQLNNVYTINPRMVLLLQASYSRWSNDATGGGYRVNEGAQLGIPGVNNDDASSGMPVMSFSGGGQAFSGVGTGSFTPDQNFQNVFQYKGDLTFSKGAHSMKLGTSFIRRQVAEYQSQDPHTTFTYQAAETSDTSNTSTTGNSLASFLLGNYYSMTRTEYLVHPGARYTELGEYFQDDWRVNGWLTLNLGLRYDFTPPFTEEHGRISNINLQTLTLVGPGHGCGASACVNSDKLNFAPRFGYAAQVNRKTVVRGGFGINYAPDLQGTPGAMRNNPFNDAVSVVAAQQYLSSGLIDNGGPPILNQTWANSTSGANIAGGIAGVEFNYKIPRTYQYNTFVERELPMDLLLKVGYVGNVGRDLSGSNSSFNFDGAAPGAASVATRYVYAAQLPNVTSIPVVNNYFNSSYNSLQTTLAHRFAHGLGITVNHVWAHAIDDQNYRYVAYDSWIYFKANSNTDIRSRVSITMNYNLPFKVHETIVNNIVRGWALGTIGIVQTGSPLSITQTGTQTNGATGTNYPLQVAPSSLPNNSYAEWFNTAAFVAQPNYQWSGDNLQNAIFGPGKWNFDTSLQRVFRIKEHVTLQFRLENFDVTNTQTPQAPNTQLGNVNFGKITATGGIGGYYLQGTGNRHTQLGLKIIF